MIFHKRLSSYVMPAFVLLAASCNNNIAPEPDASGCEVCFVVGIDSRASVITKENINSNGATFSVFGDIKSDKEAHALPQFNDCEVSYIDGTWQYYGERYWIPNYEHSFVALYPANSRNLSTPQYSNSQLKFTYTQPANYKDATDVLIATHRRKYTEGSTTPVSFRFGHILSNFIVDVTYLNPAVAQNGSLILNSITFKNIPTVATYDITPASLGSSGTMTSDYTHGSGTIDGWTLTDRGDVKIEFPTDGANVGIIPNDGAIHHLFSNDDALVLLPNPETSTELVLSYSVCEDFGTEMQTKTSTVTIPQSWRAGQNVTLLLSLTDRKVIVSIEVAAWKEGTTTETTVPRK